MIHWFIRFIIKHSKYFNLPLCRTKNETCQSVYYTIFTVDINRRPKRAIYKLNNDDDGVNRFCIIDFDQFYKYMEARGRTHIHMDLKLFILCKLPQNVSTHAKLLLGYNQLLETLWCVMKHIRNPVFFLHCWDCFCCLCFLFSKKLFYFYRLFANPVPLSAALFHVHRSSFISNTFCFPYILDVIMAPSFVPSIRTLVSLHKVISTLI